MVQLAEALPASAWQRLERLPKYEILTEPRQKAFRYKEQIVVQKEFRNQKLVGEDLAEMDYQPVKCGKKYRLGSCARTSACRKERKHNLKSWYGLLTHNRQRGLELVRMEFRRFLHAILLIPCQVVRTARRVIYRVLSYNRWLKDFFATWERLQNLVLVE